MRGLWLGGILSCSLWSSETHYSLGVGTVFMNYPSYMGSKESQQLLLPVPDFEYKSPKTTIDKDGIEHKLFDIRELSVDLSVGGSLPVDSKSSQVRQGMPDLDLAFEVGPRLKYQLYHQTNHQLLLRLPLRAVMTTDFQEIRYRGYLITPNLNYKYQSNTIEYSIVSGPLWSNQRYNDYFYGVSKAYVTNQREAYHATAGYSGYRNSMSIEQHQGKWKYGGFIAHFDLHGSSFEDSPLIETKEALFVGTYLSYIFYSH